MTEPTPEELECVEVVITAESADWLANLTWKPVEDRLVAYGHNTAQIRSIFRWKASLIPTGLVPRRTDG